MTVIQNNESADAVLVQHNGANIEITRVKPDAARRFYIEVTWCDGQRLYSGFSSPGITKIEDAKREAIREACLN